MATTAASQRVSGLARALVQQGMITEADAENLQSQANASRVTFVEQIITAKRVGAPQLAAFAARTFGVPLMDLNAYDLEQIPKEVVDPKTISTRRLLPLYKRANRIFVAVSDPTNLQGLEEVRFKTNLVVDPIVVEDDKLGAAIGKIVEAGDRSMSTLVSNDDLEVDLQEDAQPASDDEGVDVDDAPVVKYLQKIMLDAINAGVSDIHLEPYEKYYRIRYRLDGVLMEVAQPPLVIKDKIASRIKVISKLDIAERRVPQDGRLKLVLSKNRAIDFRVSTLPTLYGEKIVMRILDSSSAMLGIDALGYDPDQREALMNAIQRPYG
ncbi:MAG: type IV-A pilus assembly ATPase PilB, partial [Burkholderiales bacterium]